MSNISIEEAVRQTIDALELEDHEERIEDALTEIAVLASSFGHERDYRAGWEEQFAGMYIRPLGTIGMMALTIHLGLGGRDLPDGKYRRLFHEGDALEAGELVYMTLETWLTLIIKSIFVRLGH
jgi:hypothetical protein